MAALISKNAAWSPYLESTSQVADDAAAAARLVVEMPYVASDGSPAYDDAAAAEGTTGTDPPPPLAVDPVKAVDTADAAG